MLTNGKNMHTHACRGNYEVLTLVGCVLVVGTAAWFLFGTLLSALLSRGSAIAYASLPKGATPP